VIFDKTADQRILRGATASLTVTLRNQDGDPADAGGTLTVQVQKADGTDLLAAGSSTTNPAGTGNYTRSLTAAQTASTETLTATWTDGGDSSTRVTVHEIVGGFYFSVGDARLFDPTQLRSERYNNDRLIEARRQVEDEFERICNVAFVPRFRRARLSGNGQTCIMFDDPMVRTVRTVRVYDSATTYSTFTSAQLAALGGENMRRGLVERLDGNTWTWGESNIVVEYEHGFDRPPEPVRQAAFRRVVQMLSLAKSAIPFNAISYTPDTGVTYRLSTPSDRRTGDPEIDAVLARHSFNYPGIG
jgi:hypothetical protein